MQRLNAILLIIALTAPFAFKTWIAGDYLLNQNYYATVLCENKDQVEKKCNGLCQLNQQLSDNKTPENGVPEQMPNIELSTFIFPLLPSKEINTCYESLDYIIHYLRCFPSGVKSLKEKPPTFSC